jgi:hypothetical protein
MREMRPCGFVRGVPGDWHPYRDSQTFTFGKSLAVIHEEHLEGSMEPLQLEDETLPANVVEALRFVGISAV